MSLIGVDVGTSAVKAAVYREDGGLVSAARVPVQPQYPRPGHAELSVIDVWHATRECLAQIAATASLRHDPPQALAISASGDEVFPVDSQGQPLAPCILSSDTRGQAIEVQTLHLAHAHEWYDYCGHVPERMDPVNRIMWWCANEPQLVAQVSRFLGWHEYLITCLCGAAVTDPSLAAKWAIFDFNGQKWSEKWITKFDFDPQWLPEIRPWGTPVGTIYPSLAEELGLPRRLLVGVGAFDSLSAALGAGASGPGTVGLACGSWEVVVAPTDRRAVTPQAIEGLFPIVPHPGTAEFAVLAQSPNGSSIVEWFTSLFNQDHPQDLLGEVADHTDPSPVLAIPHLSGSINPQTGGRASRAALMGMTQATTSADMLKALMESVAFDLALTLQLLRESALDLRVLRATGGGTRSPWWMQLKADLTDTPIEVVDRAEPGTFGAALLAGASAGIYASAGRAAEAMSTVERRYEPDERRSSRYSDRLAAYQQAVSALLPTHQRLADDLS